MLKVCLVAHHAYEAIKGGHQGAVGGVERQTSLMARWLASKGHKVSLLTWSDGHTTDEVIDGVEIIKICRRDKGLAGIRFFHPRWTGLISAMKRADADVYYQNCGEYVTGQVALWCKSNSRKFIYSLASDADADPSFPIMKTMRERILYKYGLLNADKIIAQTSSQQASLKNGFHLESIVMPMPCPGPNVDEYTPLIWSQEKPVILWAARIHPCKRLELLLDIACELIEFHFKVAGSVGLEDAYSQGLLDRMKQMSNVSYLGMVPRDEMPALYRSSTVLCCSSEYEGFPNTFLEAWSHGLPIVSTFDPDNLINDRALGFSATNKDELITGLRDLCCSHELWNEHSSNARRYYQQNHSVNQVMERFEQIFSELTIN